MKVIIDTNLWISFLIGHQTQLVRRMLTDLRFDVYVCDRLINEIRDVANRDKIRKYITPTWKTCCPSFTPSVNSSPFRLMFLRQQFVIQKTFISLHWQKQLMLITLSVAMPT